MKKLPLRFRSSSVRKVVCTVSASALMLGVSSGATIGLHFMENYCGNAYSYTGYPVTMTAFGIAPSGWENLAMMPTGYSCNALSPQGIYTTNEVISTTTSTNGLNPLPNGSLSVTWSANGANFSGFGGYGMIPIFGNPAFDGPPPVTLPTGESEIYLTFLRDGVNFGVGSVNGDNTAPGYMVDVTGLKSVFTNTPFVVELIASSDSIQYLTNAFVIDAANLITNSVTYPSTPFPFNNEGGTGNRWYRGHGGGLSTGTSVGFNTDHIQIMSNHPQHGANPAPNGFDLGGTISGFIITDKPLVTMSPQPVGVGLGDTVTWSAYAIGVPPLSYQWLKNGAPIPGATTLSFGLTNVTTANLGKYSLLVTNLYGSATSSVVSVDQVIESPTVNLLVDSNPEGPAHNGLNSNATWLASFTDPNGTNLNGIMSFNGTNSQITVPPFTAFNSTYGTIMFWMQSTQASSLQPPVLLDRYTDTNGDGLRIVVLTGYIEVQFGSGPTKVDVSTAAVNDGNWHHVAVSYDLSGVNGVNVYQDGTLVNGAAGTPFFFQPNQEVELGLSHNTISVVATLSPTYLPYQGLMSDFRFYTTNLTADQIASVYNSGTLADTNHLAARLSFATPPSPGLLLTWQVQDGILQSAPVITGPWTDVGVLQPKYLTLPSQPKVFYRYRGHTPVTQVSNPFLM